MQVGVTLPQSEIPADPLAVRDFVQAVEASGFDHIVMADHVLGADHTHHPVLAGAPYNHENAFHEPFVLMGYLAAYTTTLELVTSILIFSSSRSGRRLWWPSRRRRSISSVVAVCGWALGWDGTPWSLTR